MIVKKYFQVWDQYIDIYKMITNLTENDYNKYKNIVKALDNDYKLYKFSKI